MHSTSNLEDGYIGSGKKLWLSIRKHGRENHECEILEWLPDRDSLKTREKELVNEELIQNPMCMNLKVGGEGGFVVNKEAAAAGARGMLKKLWSNEEFRRKKSIEITERNKRLHKEGKLKAPNWKGKKHNEYSRKMTGEKNSLNQKGEKNSQFGKKWIYNPITKENRKIGKNDEIPSGWLLGRKMK